MMKEQVSKIVDEYIDGEINISGLILKIRDLPDMPKAIYYPNPLIWLQDKNNISDDKLEEKIFSATDISELIEAYIEYTKEINQRPVEKVQEGIISDGMGNSWSKICPVCNQDSMKVIGINKVECLTCEDEE